MRWSAGPRTPGRRVLASRPGVSGEAGDHDAQGERNRPVSSSTTPGKQADIAIIDMRSPHLDGFGGPVAAMGLGTGPADVKTVMSGDIAERDDKLLMAQHRQAPFMLIHRSRDRLPRLSQVRCFYTHRTSGGAEPVARSGPSLPLLDVVGTRFRDLSIKRARFL